MPRRTVRLHRSPNLFTPVMARNACRLRRYDLEGEGRWVHLFFDFDSARVWVAAHRPDYLELYDFYAMDVQRLHLFRALYLETEGGIWLDVMFRPARSWEDFRKNGRFACGLRRRLDHGEFEGVYRLPCPAEERA